MIFSLNAESICSRVIETEPDVEVKVNSLVKVDDTVYDPVNDTVDVFVNVCGDISLVAVDVLVVVHDVMVVKHL